MLALKRFLRHAIALVLSRNAAQKLNRALFKLATLGMGIGFTGAAHPDERRFLERLRRQLPHPVILDVGANRGQYATLARSIFPAAKIYSFEPSPSAFRQLEALAPSLTITAIPAAVGATDGSITLFDFTSAPGSECATVMPGMLEEIYGLPSTATVVDLTTLDSFLANAGLSHIDLLKIDVEGFELEVLQGAKNALGRGQIDHIQLEFNEMNALSRTFVRDFKALLPNYNLYRLLWNGDLLDLDHQPILRRELFGYQNLIAIRNPKIK